MNKRFPGIVGLLVALLLVVSFVVPANMVSPTGVKADPGILEWTIVDTPDSIPVYVKEVYSPGIAGGPDMGSEIIKLLIAPDGNTMWAVIGMGQLSGTVAGTYQAAGAQMNFRKSTNGGRIWSGTAYGNLVSAMALPLANQALVWDMAIAPDDANIAMVAVSRATSSAAAYTQEVWITTDGGNNWDNTQWPPAAAAITPSADYISAMDITIDYGSARKVLVATRNAAGTASAPLSVMKIPGFGGWNVQNGAGSPVSLTPFTGAILDAHFSPTFGGDSTIIVLYTDAAGAVPGTYLITGSHDIATNRTDWGINGSPIEIKNSTSSAGYSPLIAEIISGMIALPSDYSGQSASLRRVYVSTDAISVARAAGLNNTGVYRIDDTVVYTLMDNSATWGDVTATGTVRRAASIAYWGTYASGKLLVGERLGYACTASVPVWFTDSPTVCPIPCWYPSKKPPTGAANQTACVTNTHGYGNAFVVWSPKYADQGVAYAVTSAAALDRQFAPALFTTSAAYISPTEALATRGWPNGTFNVVKYDESAMSLTRNNGETFNQMALIDTIMTKLTDVAVSADCSTVYLVSVNVGDNTTANCADFDSVWRSTSNAAVVDPPLPALPIGQVWERVRTSPTATSCNSTAQSQYAIVRLAPDKLDGQIVFWGAGGANGFVIGGLDTNPNTMAAAWSPDYGDYWANITPRIEIQDMAAESSTVLYVLKANGQVQKMPYTGTAWSSTVTTTNTNISGGHTIEAMAEGKVLVGNIANQAFAAAYSTNGATSFSSWSRTALTQGNFHAIFDPDFATNKLVYVADDAANQSQLNYAGYPTTGTVAATTPAGSWAVSTGRIYRNDTDGLAVEWTDMYTNGFFWGTVTSATAPHGFYGIVATNAKNVSAQPTLYAATGATPNLAQAFSSVMRTLTPRSGIPKPGISWDQLIASSAFYQTFGVLFTLEPKSLKFCGCLTDATDTTLYAIDNDWYANNHNVRKGAWIPEKDPASIVDSTWPPTMFNSAAWTVRTTGMLWAYTDCVAKRGPKLTMDDGTIIGCDPATGRNQEVNFTWEQLCVANSYQIRVAKDSKFTLMMADVTITPVSVTSPAFIYLTAGGVATYNASTTTTVQTATTLQPLECGHKYFWEVRVRGAVTGELLRSPYSDIRAFTIKAGFRVTTPYYGPQLLEPINGCGCACDAPINFSWSPFKETQKYKFELSENADMTSPVVSVEVGTTAYQYKGTIKCNQAYFWRVMATQPAPSEWSAVFTFKTQKAPVTPTQAPIPEEKTPIWVWVLIAIGAILVIVTLVLIFKTRRV